MATDAASVLVYYANNPFSEPYHRMIGWLLDSGRQDLAEIGKRLSEDLEKFPCAVFSETSELLRAANPLSFHLVIATNDGLRNGGVLTRKAGTRESHRSQIALPKSDEAQFGYHPLSHYSALSSVMDLTRSAFGESSITLVTKSHGSERLALTSLLSRHLGVHDREVFLQGLGDAIGATSPRVRNMYLAPARQLTGAYFLGAFLLEELANGIGSTKLDYLAALGNNKAAKFDLVVMESCSGALSSDEAKEIPPNIAALYNANGPAQYSGINYRAVVEQTHRGESLASAVVGNLPPELKKQSS